MSKDLSRAVLGFLTELSNGPISYKNGFQKIGLGFTRNQIDNVLQLGYENLLKLLRSNSIQRADVLNTLIDFNNSGLIRADNPVAKILALNSDWLLAAPLSDSSKNTILRAAYEHLDKTPFTVKAKMFNEANQLKLNTILPDNISGVRSKVLNTFTPSELTHLARNTNDNAQLISTLLEKNHQSRTIDWAIKLPTSDSLTAFNWLLRNSDHLSDRQVSQIITKLLNESTDYSGSSMLLNLHEFFKAVSKRSGYLAILEKTIDQVKINNMPLNFEIFKSFLRAGKAVEYNSVKEKILQLLDPLVQKSLSVEYFKVVPTISLNSEYALLEKILNNLAPNDHWRPNFLIELKEKFINADDYSKVVKNFLYNSNVTQREKYNFLSELTSDRVLVEGIDIDQIAASSHKHSINGHFLSTDDWNNLKKQCDQLRQQRVSTIVDINSSSSVHRGQTTGRTILRATKVIPGLCVDGVLGQALEGI